MSEKKSFSKYGLPFQEELVYHILTDRPFADQMEEVLDPKYFELKYLALYVKSIFDFRMKYVKHPAVENMSAVLATIPNLDTLDKEMLDEYHDKIVTQSSRFDQKDFVKEVSLDFCRKMKVADAIMRSIKHLEEENFDSIKSEIEKALKLGDSKNYGLDYKKDFEERYKMNYRLPVATGWPVLNELMAGGLASGELGLVIAPSGVGKSFALSNIGAAALREGKNVLYYTLELSEELVARRFDSHMAGIDLNKLDNFKDEIEKIINECPGKLIVKEFATKSVGLNGISKHMDLMNANGFTPDIVIVDYVDLLKSTNTYDEKRHELESTYEGLRGLAKIYKIPIWTASQTNRAGSKQEFIDSDSIAEAYSKIFVADFVMTIARTPADVEADTGRVFIAKNRLGRDKIKLLAIIDNAKGVLNIVRDDKGIKDYKDKLQVAHNKEFAEKLEMVKKQISKK